MKKAQKKAKAQPDKFINVIGKKHPGGKFSLVATSGVAIEVNEDDDVTMRWPDGTVVLAGVAIIRDSVCFYSPAHGAFAFVPTHDAQVSAAWFRAKLEKQHTDRLTADLALLLEAK